MRETDLLSAFGLLFASGLRNNPQVKEEKEHVHTQVKQREFRTVHHNHYFSPRLGFQL